VGVCSACTWRRLLLLRFARDRACAVPCASAEWYAVLRCGCAQRWHGDVYTLRIPRPDGSHEVESEEVRRQPAFRAAASRRFAHRSFHCTRATARGRVRGVGSHDVRRARAPVAEGVRAAVDAVVAVAAR
jgi:hypothetical protein